MRWIPAAQHHRARRGSPSVYQGGAYQYFPIGECYINLHTWILREVFQAPRPSEGLQVDVTIRMPGSRGGPSESSCNEAPPRRPCEEGYNEIRRGMSRGFPEILRVLTFGCLCRVQTLAKPRICDQRGCRLAEAVKRPHDRDFGPPRAIPMGQSPGFYGRNSGNKKAEG